MEDILVSTGAQPQWLDSFKLLGGRQTPMTPWHREERIFKVAAAGRGGAGSGEENYRQFHMDEVFGWISRGVEEHLVYKG
jgi:hypothetical protein